MLQPEHQIGDCATKANWEGCIARKPHCITQITPDEIVSAYDRMINFIKSDIRATKCPPIIRNANQIFALYSET